jgi:MFS family permease
LSSSDQDGGSAKALRVRDATAAVRRREAADRSGGMLRSLRHRDFRLFWIGLGLAMSRTMIAASAVAVCVLTYAGLIEAWQLLAFVLLTGVCYAFDLPTRQAMIHDLVPARDFVNAVALSSSVIQASRIVGPAIGGATLALVGAGLVSAGAIGLLLVVRPALWR